MIWIAIPALVVAAAANRLRIGRATERRYAARFSVGADGIAEGARGFTLRGTNGRSLLMLHGSGDTPQSVRYLAEKLNSAGYTVSVPLLPGHGRSPREFVSVSASEYHDAATSALEELQESSEWVGVLGQSMGAAIVVRLAAELAGVRAAVLLAPYVNPPPQVLNATRLSWLWGAFTPYIGGRGEASVHDKTAAAQNMAYGTFTPNALRALVETARTGREALARVVVPVLVVNSTQDNRIPRPLAEAALRDAPKQAEVRWVTGCGHVISMDYCKDEVASIVTDFLERQP